MLDGIMAVIAMVDPNFRAKLLIIILVNFLVGVMMGAAISYSLLSVVLGNQYNAKLAQVTKNDTLACFNVEKLGISKGDAIVVSQRNLNALLMTCAKDNKLNVNYEGFPWNSSQ